MFMVSQAFPASADKSCHLHEPFRSFMALLLSPTITDTVLCVG